MKRKKKDRNIQMRARKADIALIDRAAAVSGSSRSAFIRQAAEAYARRVLATSASHR